MPTAGALILSRSGPGYREEGFFSCRICRVDMTASHKPGPNKVSLSNLVSTLPPKAKS